MLPSGGPGKTGGGGGASGVVQWRALVMFLLLLGAMFWYLHNRRAAAAVHVAASDSIYSFVVTDINSRSVSLRSFANQPILIVNVASKCGLTNSNYKQLQMLYDKYNSKGLQILAFPCNQFGKQEPGSSSEILRFVRDEMKVSFPIMKKVEVNGANEHPVYTFLKQHYPGDISWNFEKFLIDKNGVPYGRYSPQTEPKDLEVEIIKVLYSSNTTPK